MPRPRRMYLPNQPIFVTTKTIQSRFLLKPTKEANRCILGILARCTHKHPEVKLHAYVFLSNHYHLIVSAEDPRHIPKFMALLNSELAKKVGNKIHKWAEKVFGRRYTGTPILDDESLAERLTYILMHGAKENLVKTPEEWPGIHCIDTLIKRKKVIGYWRDESRAYAKRAVHGNAVNLDDCDVPYELKVAPIPAEKPRDCVTQCYQVALQKVTKLQGKKKPLGTKKILKQDPHSKPKKIKEPTPMPWCHAMCDKHRLQWRTQYQKFCEAIDEATSKLGEIYRRDFVCGGELGFLPAQI